MKSRAILIIICLFSAYYADAQKDTISPDMSFDFGLTRDKNINLWPVMQLTRTAQSKELQILFPISDFKKDYENKQKHSHLFPIWWHDSSSVEKDTRILSLYYPSLIHTRKRTDYKSFTFFELAPKINLLEVSRSADGMIVDNNFLFLLWYKNNKIENKSSLGIFPVYWNFKSPNSHYNILAPIFASGTYNLNRSKFFAFTPLYWHTKTPELKRNILFPVIWNKKSLNGQPKDNSTLILPIYWSKNTEDTNSSVLFPLVWSLKNPDYKSFTIFPVFSKGTRDSTSKYFCFTPLLWHSENPQLKKTVLFPLWWKETDKENQSEQNIFFPVYWKLKNPNSDIAVLFPLFWKVKDSNYSSKTFIPFISKGISSDSTRTHFAFTPVYWKFTQFDKQQRILFPLFWNTRKGVGDDLKKTNVLFPIFVSHKTKTSKTSILFPLLLSFENQNYKSFTFFPFYSKGASADSSGQYFAITPLLWHNENEFSKRTVLFPIIWQTTLYKQFDTIQRNVFFPIYWKYKDSQKDNAILFPIIWNLRSDLYRSFTLFPIFSKSVSSDSSRIFKEITPLYWRYEEPGVFLKLFFPFYLKTRKGLGDSMTENKILFPVYWKYKDFDTENKIIFPLIWKFSNYDYKSFTFFPFVSKGQSRDSLNKYLAVTPLYWKTKNDTTSRNVFFPIFWNKKTGTGENETKSNVLLPVFWSYKDIDDNIKVLFPIMWKINTSNYKSFTFFPFFSKGMSADSTYKHRVITPFLWHIDNHDVKQDVLFPIWWKRESGYGAQKVVSNNLLPLFFKTETIDTKRVILFPFVWKFINPYFKSFTFFPFFSKGTRKDSSLHYFAFTPLLWQIETPDSKFNLILPFFINKKTGDGENMTRASVLFPLFWYFKNKNYQASVFFPIMWKFNSPEHKSFTLFPFISKGSTADGRREHKVITPFIWHIRNEDEINNVFFPLYWKKQSGTGDSLITSKVFVPLFWSHKEKNKKSAVLFPIIWNFKMPNFSSFTFFPVFSKGTNADKTKKYFAFTPLIWHFENEKRKFNVLFPVYWSYKSKTTQKSVFFPLIWRFKTAEYKSFTFLPLLSFGTLSDSTKYRIVTPIFWNIKKDDSSKTTLFPIFYSHKSNNVKSSSLLLILFRKTKTPDSKYTSILWPIIASGKDTVSSFFRIAPILWYKKSKDFQYFSFQPLFYKYQNSEYKNTQILWQLFTFQKYKGEKESRNFLWKTIFWDTYENHDHEFRILYLLYANVKKAGKIEKSFFPIYQLTKDTEGNRSFFLFFYFYNSYKQKINGTDEFYQEQKIFWFIRLRSNKRWLEQKGINYTD